MTTKEERAALRKDIGRVGRAELLRLLEDAWNQLDAYAVPTLRLPFTNPCDHLDLCGDTLVEAQGDERWCTACGHRWRDTHVVIVNDEVAHGS
jgi:hypothetical protein